MADCTNLHKVTAPLSSTTPRIGDGTERIVAARHHQTGKPKFLRRDQLKTLCSRRKHGVGRIRDCDQKRRTNRKRGTFRPVGDQQAAHAMRDQHRRSRKTSHGGIKPAQPFRTDRTIPVPLLHALPPGMPRFPQGLPMTGPRITDARNHQSHHPVAGPLMTWHVLRAPRARRRPPHRRSGHWQNRP